MSYLLQGPLARIVLQGINGLEKNLFALKATGPSQKLQDYMHLAEFDDLVKQTKTLSEVTNVNPVNLMSFTRENQEVILQTFLSGGTLDVALKISGVRRKHFELWVCLADKGIEPYYSFILECEKAQGLLDLELIQKMRMGGWKGGIELYNIHHPERLGLPGPHAQVTQSVQVNVVNRPPAEKKALFDTFTQLGESDVIDV